MSVYFEESKTMKKFGAVLIALGLMAGSVFAIGTGTRELGVSGDFTFTDELDAEVTYGYFVSAQVEILGGAMVDGQDWGDEDTTLFGVMAAVDYHFTQLGTETMIPYIEGRVGWINLESDIMTGNAAIGESSDAGQLEGDAFTVGGGVGVKYLMAENVALNGAIFFDWADEEVFFDEGEIEDTEVSLELGLNFYF